ncbi:MAG: hypothetical protein HY400_06660 [Elusimicrobia bacterium]|nr:hypothetical protein [Elusimicrobiota bacterium]
MNVYVLAAIIFFGCLVIATFLYRFEITEERARRLPHQKIIRPVAVLFFLFIIYMWTRVAELTIAEAVSNAIEVNPMKTIGFVLLSIIWVASAFRD